MSIEEKRHKLIERRLLKVAGEALARAQRNEAEVERLRDGIEAIWDKANEDTMAEYVYQIPSDLASLLDSNPPSPTPSSQNEETE